MEWTVKYLPITKQPAVYDGNELIAGGVTEANAHLIAQSPRMAEWLERLVKQDGWVYQKDLDEAKEILAKAEVKHE